MQISGKPNTITADDNYVYVTLAPSSVEYTNAIAACDTSLRKCATKTTLGLFGKDLFAWQMQKVDGKYYILLGSFVVTNQPEYYFLVCSDPELKKESCKFDYKKSAITNGVKEGLEFAAFTYDRKSSNFLITASENGAIIFENRKQRIIKVNKNTNKQEIVDISKYGFNQQTNWWAAECITSIN